MAENKLRAVIYCRCSTEEESQRNALTQQVHEARECVEKKDWILTGEYVESKSGTSVSGRSAYLRLFRDLEGDVFDVVVIKSIDRLMRNVKDWYLFLDRLVQNGRRLYLYLEGKFYTPEDNLIVGIKAILAEDYSRELSKKINNAHHHRQLKGQVASLNSRTYGYIKLPDHTLAIDESERKMIERIFLLASSGYGGDRISNLLYEEGFRSRSEKKISDTSIRRIIRNPIYKGTMVMNRRHYDFELKKTMRMPESEWICHEGAVPAIVSENLWKEANRQMDQRMRKFSEREALNKIPVSVGSNQGLSVLSGKIVCGCCGAPYYRTTRHSRNKSSVKNDSEMMDVSDSHYGRQRKIIEWKCHTYLQYGRKSSGFRKEALRSRESKSRPEGCNNIHLPEAYLLDLLSKAMEDNYYQDPSERAGIIDQAISILKKVFESDEGSLEYDKLVKEKNNITYKKNILLDKLLDGVITDKDYHTKSRALDDRDRVLEEKLEHLAMTARRQQVVKERLQEIRRRIDEAGMDRATAEQMMEEISRIEVFPNHLFISFEAFAILDSDQTRDMSVTIPIQDQGLNGKSKKIQELICNCMAKNPEITAKQIAEETGLGISCIQYQIRKLRKYGKIMFTGKGGVGRWKVNQSMDQTDS